MDAPEAQIPVNKGKGNAYQWVLEHLEYPHDRWCLVWPFSRDKHGRGMLSYNGKNYWAHRLMCEMANGAAPEGKLHAAHNCGRGNEGCVNPNHLAWKSASENMEDRWRHNPLTWHSNGTARRLLPSQVKEIRGAKGLRTQGELAAQYGVSESNISNIWCNRTYRVDSKVNNWSADEDAKLIEAILLKMNFTQASKYIGRSLASTTSHAYRLGLRSGHEGHKPRVQHPGSEHPNKERDNG